MQEAMVILHNQVRTVEVLAPGSFCYKEWDHPGRKIQILRENWFVLKPTEKKDLRSCIYQKKILPTLQLIYLKQEFHFHLYKCCHR